jgi:hypothetical protein
MALLRTRVIDIRGTPRCQPDRGQTPPTGGPCPTTFTCMQLRVSKPERIGPSLTGDAFTNVAMPTTWGTLSRRIDWSSEGPPRLSLIPRAHWRNRTAQARLRARNHEACRDAARATQRATTSSSQSTVADRTRSSTSMRSSDFRAIGNVTWLRPGIEIVAIACP